MLRRDPHAIPAAVLAANQRSDELKFELLVQIAAPEPTAVASLNLRCDHFGTHL